MKIEKAIEKISSKSIYVESSGCLIWSGSKAGNGYGVIFCEGSNKYVHRVVYEFFKQNIDQGKCIMHTCDNPPCVNPSHLIMGTAKDNMLDKSKKGRARNQNYNKKSCIRGHELSEDNIYNYNGKRQCKKCIIYFRNKYRMRKIIN